MKRIKETTKSILKKINLFDPVYNIYSKLRPNTGKHKLSEKEKYYNSFDEFIKKREEQKDLYQCETVLFHGYMVQPKKKTIYNIIEKLSDRNPDVRVAILANYQHARKSSVTKIRKDMVPVDVIFFPEKADSKAIEVESTDEIKKLLDTKPYLKEATETFRAYSPNATQDYLEVTVYQYYRCYESLLNNINVSVAVIWNSFHCNHFIFEKMCRERGIKVVFIEYGALPGTFVFDEDGQMGESWPATHSDEFLNLPVSEQDCAKAQNLIDSLRESGLNRKDQPEHSENEELKSKIKSDRPIVFYAGQCDKDSGMIPYTDITKKFHSPIFTSSLDAIPYLAELCEKYDWNFIFKPHPIVKHEVDEASLPKNTIFIKNININDIIDMADVVVTILSSTVYISLIRNTPTLMLGYNQISFKGCAYEAFRKEDIEAELVDAVKNGFTSSQKSAFVKHVAQLEKHYLYEDTAADRGDLKYARSTEAAVNYFEKFLNHNEPLEFNKEQSPCSYIFCDSLTSLFSAIHIKSIRTDWYPNLVLLNSELFENYINTNELKKYFNNIFKFNIPRFKFTDTTKAELALQRREEFETAISEHLTFDNCKDIYINSLSTTYQGIVHFLLNNNPEMRLHLYDDGCNRFTSLSQIEDIIQKTRRAYTFEERRTITNMIYEILLYNLLSFTSKEKQNPALVRICNANKLSFSNFLIDNHTLPIELLKTSENFDITMEYVLGICRLAEKIMLKEPNT